MKIKTRGDEVDITLGTRFVEVYAGSKYGPVVFMEATSDPEIQGELVSWSAKNIETGEKVRYGTQLKNWQYSPALYMLDSAAFNERIKPFRPWFKEYDMGIFTNKKKLRRREREVNTLQKESRFQTLKRFFTKGTEKRKQTEQLYRSLSCMRFDQYSRYRVHELGEGYSVVEQLVGGWWKPRYLANENEYRAYEIMNEDLTFVHFTAKDIDWKSIESLPDYMVERARRLSALFPTFVSGFQNGVAKVSWQLNPDGRYYRDDDGYGMTDDEETTVYGFIDAEMNVLMKFRYIGNDWERLKEMRCEAEQKVKQG